MYCLNNTIVFTTVPLRGQVNICVVTYFMRQGSIYKSLELKVAQASTNQPGTLLVKVTQAIFFNGVDIWSYKGSSFYNQRSLSLI